jgi:diguanylate cyclase (GGDEF)-like protein
MAPQHEQTVGALPGASDDVGRLVTFGVPGVFDEVPVLELDRWTGVLQRNTSAAVAAISLSDGYRRVVKSVCAAAGASQGELAPETSLRDHILGLARAPGQTAGGSYAEVPVALDGLVVGQVCIADGRDRSWSDEDLQTLDHVAVAVSTEVALRLAKKEVERAHQLVASHNRVHELIAGAVPLREVLVAVLESVQNYDPKLRPSVLMLDSSSSTLHSGIGPSLPPEYLAGIDGVVIGPNVGTCGAAAWSGRLTITEDIARDPKWAPIVDKAQSAGLAHCWSMPIMAPTGEVLGTLAFYGTQPRRPLPEHLTLLQDWARVAGIAIERHRALERLTRDARHDGLTGLANRTAIFERLDEAIQRVVPGAMAAVLFIDLDGLKELNDTLGHDRADDMLREIGERLSATVRASDLVGRFGGDEFVVVTEGMADPEEAAELGLRLLDAISQPLPGIEGTVVTASIGIAPVRTNNVEARDVLRDSDSAMYAAKRSGRDRCSFFQGRQHARAGRRLQLARELRGAEVRGEVRLVYQPVVSLPTLEIVGVEALARWTSPTFGEVSPVEFIPIADDTGAIIPLGAWVLRESCEAMAWLSAKGCPLMLNVNVSARQVSNPEFTLWARQTLAHAEFPAERLCLEITETALMRPDTTTKRNLQELAALGARIVLDDFGTGYSSLSWLKEHPFSEIKVDRSFISGLPADEGDLAIVGGVVAMARAFGSLVTAEGVETIEQLGAVQSLGCDRAQGFLFARPLGLEDLTKVLEQWSSSPLLLALGLGAAASDGAPQRSEAWAGAV